MPRATVADTARVVGAVLAPLVARGVIVRRPRVVGLAERVDADARAVRLLQRLRRRYGDGPLELRVPVRSLALVLSPDDARRVLAETPEPFATANLEKRAALSHFQPEGVLVSHGAERADRRRFNEEVLDAPEPVHRRGDAMLAKLDEEVGLLLTDVDRTGTLTWDGYIETWWRIVRRIVLGDAARDDHELTDLLTRLRSHANWSYLRPTRARLRRELHRRIADHVRRAEPGSLAELVATVPATSTTEPVQQVPQWLFAFDPAGMAGIRALALVAAHAGAADRAREELGGRELGAAGELPYLRACVLESLRLWPTTPAILRDTTAETTWDTGTLPEGAAVVVYAPFFHRDDHRLDEAHRFAPGLWAGGRRADDWPLVPFSAGPGTCPGRNVALLTASAVLAALLRRHDYRLDPPSRLDERLPMPGTFSPFSLRFTATAATG